MSNDCCVGERATLRLLATCRSNVSFCTRYNSSTYFKESHVNAKPASTASTAETACTSQHEAQKRDKKPNVRQTVHRVEFAQTDQRSTNRHSLKANSCKIRKGNQCNECEAEVSAASNEQHQGQRKPCRQREQCRQGRLTDAPRELARKKRTKKETRAC